MTTDELIVKLTNEKIFELCMIYESLFDYIDKSDPDYGQFKLSYNTMQDIYFKRVYEE